MNNRAVTLSLLMAVLAVFFVQSYVESLEDAAKKKFGSEVLVLKAKRDIKEMETIDETMLELSPTPKRYVEPSAVYFEAQEGSDDMKRAQRSVKDLAGTIAVVPIKKGEQITHGKVSDPGPRTGLAPQIAPGKRAFSVPAGETTAVGKLIKPGDRVDVIAIVGERKERISKTVLQDVVVLAVGRSITNNVARTVETDAFSGKEKVKNLVEDDRYTSVTLELEPGQVQTLALLAAQDALLMLSLRNNDDSERAPLNGTMVSDILGADAARIPRAPAGQR